MRERWFAAQHPEETRTIRQKHQVGASVTEVCRSHGLSGQTVYHWMQQHGGMDRSDVSSHHAPIARRPIGWPGHSPD